MPKHYALRLPAKAVEGEQVASIDTLENIYRLHQKPSRFYRVKRGDTVGKIAQVHGFKVSELIIANNLDSKATIYVNQNRRLPVPGERLEGGETAPESPIQIASAVKTRSEKGAVTPPRKERPLFEDKRPAPELSMTPSVVGGNLGVEHVITDNGSQTGVIRVEPEETLGHYAEWLRVPTWAIRRLNGFCYGKVLRIHQKVKIPLDNVSREQFEQARLEYHQEIQEDFFSVYKTESVQTYRVKNGDNIWTLCNEVFKVPLWLVKKHNPHVDSCNFRHSQELAIPEVEKRSKGPG